MSEHEDLEDGEIEDDEEEEEIVAPTVEDSEPVPAITVPHTEEDFWDDGDNDQISSEKVQSVKNINDAKVRLIDEVAPPKPSKRSKPAPVVDDWATSVEAAIANALKKDGVQPPMPSISHRHDDNDERQPKRKRREKQKKKSATEKSEEMEEIDLEYEMMNVRGGSPRPTPGAGAGASHLDRSDSEDSYSSDDSRDRERDRDRDRERRDRDRERDREYTRRKRKNRQRNRANRDNKKRKRDDSDDDKYHRSNGPRKMELCKFYLMDCCAKREKCLYMHSDFPCKYYYLGLKCKEKEKCLFSHGEPLTDELRAILMKHLETAPQEILGDFPRIGRESAANMVNATHRKLMEKYGMTNKTGPDGEPADGKILSLLDMVGQGGKNRRSRWCDNPSGLTAVSTGSKASLNANVGEEFLSLKYLSGVISQDQIDNLKQMGIHDLNQIMTLTVAQLNELGLSVTQIHELQLNALNMQKLRENIAKQNLQSDDPENGSEFVESTSATSLGSSKDLDMRVTPSHTSLPTKDTSNMPALGGQDVDMRFLPMINAPHEATIGDNSNSQEGSLELVSTSLTSLIKTPTVDYSQYLKDSNLNDDDDMDNTESAGNLLIDNDDDDDDEENNLKISIEEEEQDDNGKYNGNKYKDYADSEPALPQPSIFDTKLVTRPSTTHKIEYTKPFGMYRAADDEPEKPSDSCIFDRYENESDSMIKKKSDFPSRKPIFTNVNTLENIGGNSPSSHKLSDTPANTPTVGWTPTASSTAPTPAAKPVPSSNKPTRPSIYDDPYASDDSSDSDSKSQTSMYVDRDKDMRLNFLSLDAKMGEDGNTDIDLRLPFKPIMTNYIPATEIDGSITSHAPIVYQVHEVDVPKPNYKDIRRNTPRPERTKDPRLRRIFGMSNEDDSENNSKAGFSLPGLGSPKSSSSSLPPIPAAPRVDPRTKRIPESKVQSPAHDGSVTNNPGINPIHLDVQTILQRSSWYTDLSSKHKIMVNQQLAILTTEMKKYHSSDRSTDKLADFMHQLANNQMLQFILTNLNVYVDDSVSFCEVPLVPSQPPPLMSVPPPNLGMPPMGHMPPVIIPPLIQKPPSLLDLPSFNCPPEVRPGLLGVAPTMPFEQFLAMGQINKNNNPPPLLDEWVDDYEDGGSCGTGFMPNFDRNNQNNFGGNMRGNVMRNNNRGGGNFRNNERWNNSGGGGNNPNRRNNNNHRRMDKKK